jgi:hypothetical protein
MKSFQLRPLRAGDGEADATAVADASKGPARRASALRPLECCLGIVVFGLWLGLFGGGILVDTTTARATISPLGAAALQVEQGGTGTLPARAAAAAAVPPDVPMLLRAWLVVLTCFLPLNLAWLCVVSSTLGAVGNLANLGEDDARARSSDTSNPYMSAVLRGFFVYLFMMSGLLLLDDSPFSNAGPGQYIRLAGFLSLFSFVVSYQPRLFGALILSAFQRIQVRGGENAPQVTQAETVRGNLDVEFETRTVQKLPDRTERT